MSGLQRRVAANNAERDPILVVIGINAKNPLHKPGGSQQAKTTSPGARDNCPQGGGRKRRR